jgi:hypothetical protein
MAQLIQSMRSHVDWTTRAPGFDGAFMLAERSSDAGSSLSDFIHTVMPGKIKPWLSTRVKSVSWFKPKEKQ